MSLINLISRYRENRIAHSGLRILAVTIAAYGVVAPMGGKGPSAMSIVDFPLEITVSAFTASLILQFVSKMKALGFTLASIFLSAALHMIFVAVFSPYEGFWAALARGFIGHAAGMVWVGHRMIIAGVGLYIVVRFVVDRNFGIGTRN